MIRVEIGWVMTDPVTIGSDFHGRGTHCRAPNGILRLDGSELNLGRCSHDQNHDTCCKYFFHFHEIFSLHLVTYI